jgi:hypothetical protein
MGLLDSPTWAFAWADVILAGFFPAEARIVAWGAIGAAISFTLYWLMSPQARIAGMAAAEQRLKRSMWNEDAALADGLAAARDLIRLALARLRLVMIPAVIATVPLLSLAAWLDSEYGFAQPPPGEVASITAKPETAHVRWVAADAAPARIEVLGDDGLVLQAVAISVPVPVIQKWGWWNALIGNPLGYLLHDGPVDRIEIGLPMHQYLSVGPEWIRGWKALFFTTLLGVSLLLKVALRIR